jgi:hypothetical protein
MVRYSGGNFIPPGNCRRWRRRSPAYSVVRRDSASVSSEERAFGSGVANQLTLRPIGCALGCADIRFDLTIQSRRRRVRLYKCDRETSSSSVFKLYIIYDAGSVLLVKKKELGTRSLRL